MLLCRAYSNGSKSHSLCSSHVTIVNVSASGKAKQSGTLPAYDNLQKNCFWFSK